jgi:hypothetical protein
MELWAIMEALNDAAAELDAACDDGWVLTTDVDDQIVAAKRIVGATLTSDKIEVVE